MNLNDKEIYYPFLTENPEEIDFQPEIGLMVKIVHPGERFWVTIEKILDDKIIGSVANDLVADYGYSCGDLVSFREYHVFDVSNIIKPKLKKKENIVWINGDNT